jgi:endonuclease/exonuclease/phosphatase family metal-dependent hydrolase
VRCFTTRADALNVGFAIRSAARLSTTCREIRSLSLEDDAAAPHPVRRGLELSLAVSGRRVALLNVHLKSGCARGRLDDPSNAACRVLQRQVAPLERWVEERANAGVAFAVLGDWNRDLERDTAGHFPARSDASDPAGPIDPTKVVNLFAEIDDGAPRASALSLVRIDRRASAAGACRNILDQLVISESMGRLLIPAAQPGSELQGRLARGPVGASDHCSLEAELRFRR